MADLNAMDDDGDDVVVLGLVRTFWRRPVEEENAIEDVNESTNTVRIELFKTLLNFWEDIINIYL